MNKYEDIPQMECFQKEYYFRDIYGNICSIDLSTFYDKSDDTVMEPGKEITAYLSDIKQVKTK